MNEERRHERSRAIPTATDHLRHEFYWEIKVTLQEKKAHLRLNQDAWLNTGHNPFKQEASVRGLNAKPLSYGFPQSRH
jgi:hypothetical protein